MTRGWRATFFLTTEMPRKEGEGIRETSNFCVSNPQKKRGRERERNKKETDININITFSLAAVIYICDD